MNSLFISPFGSFSLGSGFSPTGPILFPDGTVALPSIAFASEPTLGFYRIGPNRIGIATAAGSAKFEFNGGVAFDLLTNNALLRFGVANDVVLTREAAAILALRDGTIAQTFKIGPTGNSLNLVGAVAGAASYLEGLEGTAPAVAPTNGFRLFSKDNGSGKTQLMVIFQSGAAIQLAIEV